MRLDAFCLLQNKVEQEVIRNTTYTENVAAHRMKAGSTAAGDRERQTESWGTAVASIYMAGTATQFAADRRAGMTVADFVQTVFVPEYVESKTRSGRSHFRSILKHIISPERVERAFGGGPKRPRTKFKDTEGWPYLDNVDLRDVDVVRIQQLMACALEHGYSPQTVAHIRNVARAIFEVAIDKQFVLTANPAKRIPVPQSSPELPTPLTAAQTKQVLRLMSYPEREMALLTLLTDMNMPEICGLQWKMVNLGDSPQEADGELIAARTLAIREQWRSGDLTPVRSKRRRELPVPDAVLHDLIRLKNTSQFTAPDDFVFATETGKPVNARLIAARKLKVLGQSVKVQRLSWQMLRRAHLSLLYELGAHSLAALCSAAES